MALEEPVAAPGLVDGAVLGMALEKKVEIKTPFGDLKVNTEVDARETGFPVYPGARRAIESDGKLVSAMTRSFCGSRPNVSVNVHSSR